MNDCFSFNNKERRSAQNPWDVMTLMLREQRPQLGPAARGPLAWVCSASRHSTDVLSRPQLAPVVYSFINYPKTV